MHFKIFLLFRIHDLARLLVMLGPIDFDRQSRFLAQEIDLVSPSVQITGAAVECTLRNGTSILWIAQTDELCEQAVQCFRQVWANRGQAWTDLRIFRLWGGNPNPVASDADVPTVIVASIQTLASRISRTLPDWIPGRDR